MKGSPDHSGETGTERHRKRESERDRDKAACMELHKKNITSLKPLTGKIRGTDYHNFLQDMELKV